MKTISFDISDNAARRFMQMTAEEKQNLNKLLNEIIEDKRSLFEVMDDMSEYAKKQGLTSDKLNDLLNEE